MNLGSFKKQNNNKYIKATFKIIGMDCAACAITIDGDLEDREGVKAAKTNYTKAQTEVEFDPEKISEKEILDVIKKSGYTAQASS